MRCRAYTASVKTRVGLLSRALRKQQLAGPDVHRLEHISVAWQTRTAFFSIQRILTLVNNSGLRRYILYLARPSEPLRGSGCIACVPLNLCMYIHVFFFSSLCTAHPEGCPSRGHSTQPITPATDCLLGFYSLRERERERERERRSPLLVYAHQKRHMSRYRAVALI